MRYLYSFAFFAFVLLFVYPNEASAQLTYLGSSFWVWDGKQVAGKLKALKSINQRGVRIAASAPGMQGKVSVEFNGAYNNKGEWVSLPFKNSDGILLTMRGIAANNAIKAWKMNVHGLLKGETDWKPLGAYDLNPNDRSFLLEIQGLYQGVRCDIYPLKGTGNWSVEMDAVTVI